MGRTPPVEARLGGLQDVTLEFAQPMQNWSNAVRSDLVRLSPAVPASCSWDSDTRLACRLEKSLAPATRYRLDVAPGLKTQTGVVLAAQHLYVETGRPSVSAHIQDWKGGRPALLLVVDMPVEPTELQSVLRMELDGRPVAISEPERLPPAWKSDTRIRFRLDVPADPQRRLLTLRVKPGLRTAAGPLRGQQDAELLRVRINDPFALLGVSCVGMGRRILAPVRNGAVTAQCDPNQPVQLVFSRLLDIGSRDIVAQRAAVVAGHVFSTHRAVTWNEADSTFNEDGVRTMRAQWAEIGQFSAGSRIELTFDDAIGSQDGMRLQPVTVRIGFGDAQPQLRARNRALVADGRQPPALVEAVNVGTAKLDVRGVGTRVLAETVLARSPRKGSVPQPVASQASDLTLAEGGWVRWSPVDASASRTWNTPESVEFAAPAFDLLAMSGKREVLAWANEWDRDAPVAGAQIELLWLDPGSTQPRVVASGRTGKDGTVLLRLPADLVVPEPDGDYYALPPKEKPLWLLRAVRMESGASQRAVLPLEDVDRAELGSRKPRAMWGVSDRPLYHAGDTVHYKLWQRELDGVHLRSVGDGPVALRLQNAEDEKVILEWQAARNQDGSLAGDLALPVHLTDATYCIGVKSGYSNTDGSCFFVGTYRAQDLWLETKSRGGVLRDGDRFVADAKAGYFSGGPAAGAEVTRATVSLEPESLETAYPEFADFTFVDVDGDDVEYLELAGVDAYEALDDNGAVQIDVPVTFEGNPSEIEKRPAFGLLTTELEVSPEDREGTSAYEQSTRYARYPRYVGLRTLPDWFDADEPVSLEAVVITAQGKEAAAAEVEVTVEYVAGYLSDLPGEIIARCMVRTRQPTPCAFARARTGFYRLIARSGDAAPATLRRYVWRHDGGLHVDVPEPELSLLDASPQRDRAARVLVKQPFAHARALFAITFGGAILDHRVEVIEGNTQEVSLPMSRDWRGRLNVSALVRESAPTKVEAGLRQPARLESLDTYLPAALLEPQAPVSVRFHTTQGKPGAHARITLRNDSPRPRQVALSVMDDALRAQAQRWLPYADPAGPTSFRESLLFSGGSGGVRRAAFADWELEDWRWLLPWAAQDEAIRENVAPRRRVNAETYAPVAMAPPGGGDSTTLDSITVTGSRIRRVDIAESNEAKAPDPTLHLDRVKPASGLESPMSAVRTRFADTALWLPDIHLAPGESREIDVPLPDNLTRWRAVAWSTDGTDGFVMTEAALEVGLPVEARLQAPVRLYPGDVSRVTTSVRHVATTPALVRTTLQVQGEGANAEESQQDAQSLRLRARGQASVATTLHPQATGQLHLVATAVSPAGNDAVAGAIEVASPLISTRKLQAGWVGEDALKLDLPALPEAASAPSLRVSLLRGGAGLTSQWTQDLHVYPHRCWEQILSRAVGAALAAERHDSSWPDATAVVDEALSNAAVFQRDNGGFVYFPGIGRYQPDASVTLTAYTLRAFALLRTLGYPVPDHIEVDAREFLSQIKAPAQPPTEGIDENFARFAYAAAEQVPERIADLDALWAHWDRLPLPVQVASARALAQAGHPSAPRAVNRVLERAPARGTARSLRLPQRYDAWMSSDLREQCAVIELLREYPKLGSALARRQLLAGMNDLYAGGISYVDTQTAASCLMALRGTSGESASLQAHFAIGKHEKSIELAPGQERADWTIGTPDGNQLQVVGARENSAPASYVAQLDYLEDARTAKPSAMGLSIERSYGVLRNGKWKPMENEILHEGDWIRVTLAVRTTAERDFVAVTDAVPGGLQPTDLDLSGVGTADLKRIADEGSGYFGTRKLDARSPRFYAERLPAGYHELHYFARVGNGGDYLAAPATVELMYGSATYARTAAARVLISDGAAKD